MAEGSSQYKGLAVPLRGNSEIQATNDTYDIVSITGYTTDQTGDFLVCQTSAGTEKFVIGSTGAVSLASSIGRMVLGTVAIASLASNASATMTLTGATTNMVVQFFNRATATTPMPNVFCNAADEVTIAAPAVATVARTVNYWMFTTA